MKKYLMFAMLIMFFNIAFAQTIIYADAKTQNSTNDSISVCKNIPMQGGFALKSDLIKLVKVDFENGIPSGWSIVNGTITDTMCTSIVPPAANNVLWFYQPIGSSITPSLITNDIYKPFNVKFDIKLSDTSNGCDNLSTSSVGLYLDNTNIWSTTNKQWSTVQKPISSIYTETDSIKLIKWVSVYQNQPSNWALDNIEVYSYLIPDSVRWYCLEDPTWTSNLKNPTSFIPNENIPIQNYVSCYYYNGISYLDTLRVYIIDSYMPIITSIDGEDSVCFNSTQIYTVNTPNTLYCVWYNPKDTTYVVHTNTIVMNSISSIKVQCFNSCGSTFFTKNIYQFNKTESQDIFFVEYDPVTSKNKINWKYSSKPIDSIYIERQVSSNNWVIVGKSLYSDLYFIDNDTINPQAMSYAYRIRAHNLCDSIGTFTSLHATISLIKSYDVQNNTYGFNWSRYYGISPDIIGSYNLYGIKLSGDVDIIASLPATTVGTYQYNYTNVNINYVKFYVGFNLNSGSKSTYTVKSNYVNSSITSINEYNSELYKIYPNPFTDNIIVEGCSCKNERIQIINELGQIIYNNMFSDKISINTESYKKGIYFMKIGNHYCKVIKK